MKLWPFSKKNDEPTATKHADPRSRKMELPQGVTLATSSEPAALPSSFPAAEPAPSTTALLPESNEPAANLPSLEAFNHTLAEPASTTAQATPDLTSFFEQNNLSFISSSNTQNPEPAPPNKATTTPLPDASPLDFLTGSTDFGLPETNTPDFLTGLPEANAFTTPQAAFGATQPEQPNPIPFEFFPPELQNPDETSFLPDTNFFSFKQTSSQTSDPTTETAAEITDLLAENYPATQPNPANALDNTTFTPSLTEGDFASNPDNNVTASATPNSDDSFFLYTTHEEATLPTPSGLFDFSPTEESGLSDFQSEIEAAFLPQPNTELPPALNLPDEALAPNGNEPFFEAAIMQTPFDPADLNDESFDLDSILQAQSDNPEAASHALDDASLTAPFTATEAHYPAPVENNSTQENLYDSVNPGIDHYFGDEAEGLKGTDNPDSYDFGHYDDPEEPAAAFILDEIPGNEMPDQDISPTALDNGFPENAEPPTPLAETDMEDTSHATPIAEDEPASYLHMPSLPAVDDMMQRLAQPVNFEGNPMALPPNGEEVLKPQNPVAEVEEAPEVPNPTQLETPAELEKTEPETKTEEVPPPKAKPAINRKPKPYQSSLTDYIGNFEQEVLLKNSQFLRHSINDLVDSYFALQDQEAS